MRRSKLGLLVLSAVGLLAATGAIQADSGSRLTSGEQMDIVQPVSSPSESGQLLTLGAPFSSGQAVAVRLPPNGVLHPHTALEIAQCAAPAGVPPTSSGGCDASSTVRISARGSADGSVIEAAYTVRSLPRDNSPIRTTEHPVACGATQATECVLYIGTDVHDLRLPHFWSQGFSVTSYPGDSGVNPGDGTPAGPPSREEAMAIRAIPALQALDTLRSADSINSSQASTSVLTSTSSLTQIISVTVTRACPEGGGGDASCNPGGGGGTPGGGGGSSGGGAGGNPGGGGQSEQAGEPAELPFTDGSVGGTSTGGPPAGVLAFTGSDLGTITAIGALALIVGWLLQRRRVAGDHRSAH